MRLLLLSGPGFWYSFTRGGLGKLSGLCSAHGATELEERRMEKHLTPQNKHIKLLETRLKKAPSEHSKADRSI